MLRGTNLYISDGDNSKAKLVTSSYKLGTKVDRKWTVSGGVTKAYINGALQLTINRVYNGRQTRYNTGNADDALGLNRWQLTTGIYLEQSHGDWLYHDGTGKVRVNFWTMPADDLDEAHAVWAETRKRAKAKDYSHLPRSKASKVAHVRTKGRNNKDLTKTPNNGLITKRCFWLNRAYIIKELSLAGISVSFGKKSKKKKTKKN